MAEEKVISFKYDGNSESIKKNQIDARLLAQALDSFADLISSADSAMYEHESDVEVRAQAGFVKGSFGVDLIVLASPEVLKTIGLVASAGVGAGFSILHTLMKLKGNKVETIEVEEDSPLAKILTDKGEVISTSRNAAKLIDNMDVRKKIDCLIRKPLENDGITSFKVYDGPLEASEEREKPTIEITKETGYFFKKPAATQSQTKITSVTKAVIEFVGANKASGSSGWRMNYLGEKELPVKIKDEKFMERIRLSDAPRFFSGKFEVELKVTVTKIKEKTVSKTYQVLRVLGPKKK